MKTLYLIRHANSPYQTNDFERPLSDIGKQEAKLMAKKLKEFNTNPDLLISSNAQRTTTTVNIISKILECSNKINFEPKAYNPPINKLVEIINNISKKHNNVFLISHNPAISLLADYLTNENVGGMPPCGIVKINLEIENWNEITQGCGTKDFFIYPSMF